VPVTLVLDPAQYFAGQPDMAFTQCGAQKSHL
jgi:hypothetical protein